MDMLFLVCCDRAPWMCQYFTSSNQLLCKSEMAECIDIHDMLRDVFSEASRIETHNCHIPSLTLTRCACMTKQLMAQETCAGTRRLGVCASPIEATFPPEEHLLRIPTKASAQDPREIEGLPLARRRSACCSQPEGHHGTNNAYLNVSC